MTHKTLLVPCKREKVHSPLDGTVVCIIPSSKTSCIRSYDLEAENGWVKFTADSLSKPGQSSFRAIVSLYSSRFRQFLIVFCFSWSKNTTQWIGWTFIAFLPINRQYVNCKINCSNSSATLTFGEVDFNLATLDGNKLFFRLDVNEGHT